MDIFVQNIWKSYNGRDVLRDFSCRIPQGSCCALLAPSGAGKTTLLRLLLGLEQPDRGRILGLPKTCAALFQENRLFPDLCAVSNVTAAAGCSAPAAAALLEQLGLDGESQKKPVRLLSGGQARRTALARALLAPGELLTLDEPFTGLDDRTRRLAAAAVAAHHRGRTVLVVTHNLEDLPLLDVQQCITLPEGNPPA